VSGEHQRLAAYFPQTTASCSDARTTRRYIKEMIARSHQKEQYCFVMRGL
jgi:hypothetical protein